MKQHIKIFSIGLIASGLMAFGFINWNDSIIDKVEESGASSIALYNQEATITNDKADLDLVYNIDSRYMATITKDDLHKAISVLDIVPKTDEDWQKASLQAVTIAILQDNDEISAIGDSEELNATQIKLLQSIDYSTNFYIKARRGATLYPVVTQMDDIVYYFTVIPEKETEFVNGNDALIEYLKERSKEKTAIIKRDKLRPCKVSFTITKEGTVADVKLISTSGYASVDETMVELITNTLGKWRPAENSKGEKVDQELVFSFGLMGC